MPSGQGSTSTSKQNQNQLTNRRYVAVRQTDGFRKILPTPSQESSSLVIGVSRIPRINLKKCSLPNVPEEFRFNTNSNFKFQFSKTTLTEPKKQFDNEKQQQCNDQTMTPSPLRPNPPKERKKAVRKPKRWKNKIEASLDNNDTTRRQRRSANRHTTETNNNNDDQCSNAKTTAANNKKMRHRQVDDGQRWHDNDKRRATAIE